MTFSTESQGTSTYLVYQINENDALDSTSLGMVSNNKIKGVAPIIFTQMDANKFFKYNITAKAPLSRYFGGTITKKRLLGALSNLVDGILAAEEYMIDTSMFVLDLNYIFVDSATCETLLICLPVTNADKPTEDMHDFFKRIVMHSQCDQTENMDYYAKIVSYLNQTTAFSTSNFGSMLKQLSDGNSSGDVSQAEKQQPAVLSHPAKTIGQQAQNSVYQSSSQSINPHSSSQYQTPANQTASNPSLISNIPSANPGRQESIASNQPAQTGEKKISMLHLLMHYNKDTKAAYKAQKQRKTNQQTPQTTRQKTPAAQGGAQFAIPGVETEMSQAPETHSNQQQVAQTSVSHSTTQQNNTQGYQNTPQQDVATRSANFGGTVILKNNPRKGTTVLGVNPLTQQNTPHLIRIKNNERINLSNQLLRVGRDKSLVEYCIGDNDAITSYHADFTSINDEYFVTDINSRNHTYVDGVMIESLKPVKLSHGMKIKLANEEFEFRMR